MEPSKYLDALHEAGDGSLFVVLDSGAGWEVRGRRVGDRIRLETWNLAENIDLAAEAISALHTLAERRVPRGGEL